MPAKNIKSQVVEGSVLLEEKPFVHVLSSEFKSVRCDHCYSSGELLRCSGCGFARYCDSDCQKSGWSLHRAECPRLRALPAHLQLPNAARLLARIIVKLKRGGGAEKGFYGKNQFRVFKDLMSHYPEMKCDPSREEHASSLYAVLSDFLGGESLLPSFPEFLGLYGRMVVNGFSILDGEMTTLGTGLYLGASTLDHSCRPNAVAVFSGTSLVIRALHSIANYTWDKVRISYIELLNDRTDRQLDLQKSYFFECDCPRCSEEGEAELAALCGGCAGPIPSPQSQTVCSKCGWETPESFISKYHLVLELSKHQHQEMKSVAYLDACKLCLAKEREVFHPSNVLTVKTLDLAFEAAIQLGSWTEAVRLGTALVSGYRKYYGDWHPLTGLLLLKLGKIQLHLGTEAGAAGDSALENLEAAETVLALSHGRRHPVFREELHSLLSQARQEDLYYRSSS